MTSWNYRINSINDSNKNTIVINVIIISTPCYLKTLVIIILVVYFFYKQINKEIVNTVQ